MGQTPVTIVYRYQCNSKDWMLPTTYILFCQKCTLQADIWCMCVWIPFHLCLFFLFLNHLDLTVLSLCVTIAHRTGMLGKEKRQWSYKRWSFLYTSVFVLLRFFKEYWWNRERTQALSENSYSWEHTSTQYNMFVSIYVCLCAHILGERLQRLPSADPLTSGTMSQRSADTKSRQVSHSTVQVHKIVLVCFSVCVCAVRPALLPYVMLDAEYWAFFGWLAFKGST